MVDVDELKELGLEALKDFFGIDNKIITNMSKEQLSIAVHKARFGMQLYRELNVNKRAVESNIFRFCTLVAKDKNELKRILNASLPQYRIGKD